MYIPRVYCMPFKNHVDAMLRDSGCAYDSNAKAKLMGSFSSPTETFKDTEPWSLDRSLTPESSSPSSGILMTDSCSIDHNASNFCTQPSLQTRGRPLSAPSVTSPFRPYVSVGACKVPNSSPGFVALPSACRRHGEEHSSSSNFLMDKLLQLLTTSGPMAASIKQKLLQGFSSGGCHKEKFRTTLAEFILNEEEKCLEIIELSL